LKIGPFNLIKAFQCKVLIFDEICATWLAKSVPNNVTVGKISTRFTFPILLSLKFITKLLWCVLTFPKHRQSLYLNYLYILVGIVEPKIILTGADNDRSLATLANAHPHILTIFVQTALRSTKQGFPTGIQIPNYFALGQREKLIFASLKVNTDSYRPFGSIKLGYAVSEPAQVQFAYRDICFISNHRPEVPITKRRSLEQAIEATSDRLFQYTCEYAKKYGLTLRLLAKSREPNWHEHERKHYERLSRNFPIQFVVADKFAKELDTYRGLFSSETIVNCASTLGFEALAIKKKVLFGASMTPGLISKWGISYHFDQLPKTLVLGKDDFFHFEEKMNQLRRLSTTEYLLQISDCASRLITQDLHNPPHLQLREVIRKHLNSS